MYKEYIMKNEIEKLSDKLVNAFLKNKVIAPLPSKFTKTLTEAQKNSENYVKAKSSIR